jgi:hypothetical protein
MMPTVTHAWRRTMTSVVTHVGRMMMMSTVTQVRRRTMTSTVTQVYVWRTKVQGQKSGERKSVDGSSTVESPWTEVQLATHHHHRSPQCYRAPVNSAAMVDDNVAMCDVASSRRRCSSRGCKLATLRRRCCDGGLSRRAALTRRVNGYVALQRWHVGPTATLLCNDGTLGRRLRYSAAMARWADGYAALQQWHAGPTTVWSSFSQLLVLLLQS